MTSKEAAHIVDVAFGVPQAVRRVGEDRTYHEGEIREAKDMAIKALEQEPCDDAISRQAVHRQINKWVASGESEKSLLSLHEKVDALPPVNPQQKMGHWINNQNGTFECNQCGCKHSKSRFCPNCGAKMEV